MKNETKDNGQLESKSRNYGIMLFNMGGPSREEEIYPYLKKIFSDPGIISLPKFPRYGLAKTIAFIRKNKVKERYNLIGGRSPLNEKTKILVKELEKEAGLPVSYAMRYTEPFVSQAHNSLTKRGVNHIIVLPLYPHYSYVTTLSALKDYKRNIKSNIPYIFISSHYNYPPFYELHYDMLQQNMEKLSGRFKTAILFVAHSIPLKQVNKGDPYVDQVRETVSLITEGRDIIHPHSIAFQSRIGPLKWQGPSMEEELKRLTSEKVEQLIVHPVSFALENLETLYDLDIVFRKLSLRSGIKNYIRVPTPGNHIRYANTLLLIIKKNIQNLEVQSELT